MNDSDVSLLRLEENEFAEWDRDAGTLTTEDGFEVDGHVHAALDARRDALPGEYREEQPC